MNKRSTWTGGALSPLLALSLVAAGVIASPTEGRAQTKTASMQVIGFARAPVGFVDFCGRYPVDCTPARNARRIVLTQQAFRELDRVNRDINARVRPVTDLELYGKAEYWEYPRDSGDCEDYVLLKRKALAAMGWPASALLITVVRDRADEGHAVLTVVTDRGDYVLDNQQEGVMLWHQTEYDYIKRQSQTDPKIWVFVGTGKPGAGIASAR